MQTSPFWKRGGKGCEMGWYCPFDWWLLYSHIICTYYITTSTVLHMYSGWWFQTCFFIHNKWENPCHWLSYFSRWLKPPTSLCFFFITVFPQFFFRVTRSSWIICHMLKHEQDPTIVKWELIVIVDVLILTQKIGRGCCARVSEEAVVCVCGHFFLEDVGPRIFWHLLLGLCIWGPHIYDIYDIYIYDIWDMI